MKYFQRTLATLGVIALAGCAGTGSISQRVESASTSAAEQQAKKEAAMPHCDLPIGTVAIAAPEKNWWQAYQLQSPDALIKLFVMKSGCFTVLDRGRGFAIAERERQLASGGGLQQGSNIGGGQIKAADYVITPDIVVNNNNSGGTAIGAILGGFIPVPGFAMLASQMNLSDKSAQVTLAITDVRTSEQLITSEGKAEKTDIGFGFGGAGAGGSLSGIDFGAVGASSYANTSLGQVVAMAYLDAYSKVIDRIKQLRPAAASAPQATPAAPPASTAPVQLPPTMKTRPVAMAKVGHLFTGPSETSGVIRELSPGSILYPAGHKTGTWLQVTDDNGQVGWVSVKMLGK